MTREYYKIGDWNAVCDRCGFKFKASELVEDWEGFRVCAKDFEERHPLDFLRVAGDRISVPWVRSEASTALQVIAASVGSTINGAAINNATIG